MWTSREGCGVARGLSAVETKNNADNDQQRSEADLALPRTVAREEAEPQVLSPCHLALIMDVTGSASSWLFETVKRMIFLLSAEPGWNCFGRKKLTFKEEHQAAPEHELASTGSLGQSEIPLSEIMLATVKAFILMTITFFIHLRSSNPGQQQVCLRHQLGCHQTVLRRKSVVLRHFASLRCARTCLHHANICDKLFDRTGNYLKRTVSYV